MENDKVDIVDGNVTVVVAGFPGRKVKAYGFSLSSKTLADFTVRSGDTELFVYGSRFGTLNPATAPNEPVYETGIGEALTIQSSVAMVNANVRVQYAYGI